MPVPPQRSASWNPMRDVVGRVREIAGHSAGGSLTDEARRALPGAGERGRQFFTDGWQTAVAVDEVTNDAHTAINSSLSGLTIGGPRRMGDFRLLLTGWSPTVAGGPVNVIFGAALVSTGGAHISDSGMAAMTFRWWIGGGAPWDPLPLIQIGFPATVLTFDPEVQLSLDYEA